MDEFDKELLNEYKGSELDTLWRIWAGHSSVTVSNCFFLLLSVNAILISFFVFVSLVRFSRTPLVY